MDWTVAFLLYLFTRLDAIQGLFVALGIIAACITLAGGLVSLMEDAFEDHKKIILSSAAIGIICAFLAVLTPTQKDMAIIVGGAIGYEQANNLVSNERLQRLSDNSLKALEMWVEEQAKETEESE